MSLLRRGARLGRYKIERLLAQGAMGQIHVASDEMLRRKVAIKTMFSEGEVAVPLNLRERFIREARAAAALTHANAVHVYEVGEHEGMPFIAMELIEGVNLRTYSGSHSLDVPTKMKWMRDVADVLAVAHRLGLVHRDVKPENMMVRNDGVIKVLDFGVVKRVANPSAMPGSNRLHSTIERTLELTAEGVVLGTPRYMSPEAFEGVVSPAGDQFSWGLTTYELLTGAHPYAPPANVPHYEWLMQTEPPDLETRATQIPAGIARAVMRAMSKRVDRRFPSMDTLVQALDLALRQI
jgi:eukaryotic-like serine/threonine-protein kinase